MQAGREAVVLTLQEVLFPLILGPNNLLYVVILTACITLDFVPTSLPCILIEFLFKLCRFKIFSQKFYMPTKFWKHDCTIKNDPKIYLVVQIRNMKLIEETKKIVLKQYCMI